MSIIVDYVIFIINFFNAKILKFFNKKSKFSNNDIYTYPNFCNHRTINVTLYSWPHQISINDNNLSNKLKFFIFNKNKIDDIDKYLSYLHISKYDPLDMRFIKIENVEYEFIEYSTLNKNYNLKIVKNFDNIYPNKSIFDKLISAKILIMIMNEVKYDELNLLNYSILVKWYLKNARNV